MAQTGGYLRYNGPMNTVLVENYGHFSKGEAKLVDYLTFCAFSSDECKAEGWETSKTSFSTSNKETVNDPAKVEPAPTTLPRMKEAVKRDEELKDDSRKTK